MIMGDLRGMMIANIAYISFEIKISDCYIALCERAAD